MKLHKVLPFFICAVIIIFFFIIIFKNSVDIPNGDDLFCLMLFTQQFEDAPSWAERFRLLVEQWVEHRIVYSRFTALLSFWIHGQVNFVTVILIGNFTLVGFTFLFWKIFKKIEVSMYYLIPIVLTLFSPVMYEANVWAGACTVYMPVCFLGLLAMYFLASPWRAAFPLALVTALLATFSFGNGMFCFPAGFLMLVMSKKYKAAGIWLLFGCAATMLYFFRYQTDRSAYALGVASHFLHFDYIIYNFLGFVGGIIDYTENIFSRFRAENVATMLLGALLTSVILIGVATLLVKRNHLKTANTTGNSMEMAWLGMVLFVGITSLAMAYSRTSGAQMHALTSRYKIFSMIAFILAYWWCLMNFKKRYLIGVTFGGFSFLLLISSYFNHYQKLSNQKSTLLAGLYNYSENNKWVIYQNTSYFENASLVLADSIKKNPKPIYSFVKIFQGLNHKTLGDARILEEVEITESCDSQLGRCATVSSHHYPSVSNFFDGVYLVVYTDKNIYLFPAEPVRNGRINMVSTGKYFKNGFWMNADLGEILEAGTEYRFAIFCPTETEKIRLLNYRIKG